MSKKKTGRRAPPALRRPRKAGLLPDIHAPKEDRAALRWAVKTLKDQEITHLILLGDLISLDSVSRFRKTLKTAASLPAEIQRGRQIVMWLEKQLPGVKKTYLAGNHEARLYNYLLRHAPELAELPELEFKRLLQVPDDWQFVEYPKYIIEQGVLVQHGRKFSRNATRARLVYGCSAAAGHSHRVSMVHHKQPDGKTIQSCEVGCLCQWDQGYASMTDWGHACGTIYRGQITIFTRGGKVWQ